MVWVSTYLQGKIQWKLVFGAGHGWTRRVFQTMGQFIGGPFYLFQMKNYNNQEPMLPASQQTLPQQAQANIDIQSIRSHLSNLDYPAVSSLLTQLQSLPCSQSEPIKKSILHQLKAHLKQVYGFKSKDPAYRPTYDLDAMLDLVALLILRHGDQDYRMLGQLVREWVAEDAKYAFVMYRAKCASFGEETRQEIARKLKFTSSSALFLQKMLANKPMLSDYLSLLSHNCQLYEQSHSLQLQGQPHYNQYEEKSKQRDQSIEEAYLYFCNSLLKECIRICGQGEEKEAGDIYGVIDRCVPACLCVRKFKQSETISRQVQLMSHIQTLINSIPHLYKPNNLLKYPTAVLVALVARTHNLPLLASQSLHFLILAQLLLRLSPSNTLGQQAGSCLDSLEGFLQRDVVFKLCVILIRDGLTVQGESCWIGDHVKVDLGEVYRRLAMYIGFLSPQHHTHLMQTINSVLQFRLPRYEECPSLAATTWYSILSKTLLEQIPFRIHCIGQYRKTLVSHKPSLQALTFESHPFHSHSHIFLDAGNLLLKLLKLDSSPLHYDYLGHLISFVVNWLLCVRLYRQAYGQRYQACMLADLRARVKGLVEEIKARVLTNKGKQEGKEDEGNDATQIQLILMRINQINFQD